MSRDYYEILGVSRNADVKEIKSAFKRLAREHHPDVAKDKEKAEQVFGQINEAYSILSDDQKRAYYDRHGQAPGASRGGHQGGGGFDGFGFGDIFETIFGGGGGGRRRQGPSRGSDIRMSLGITLEDAFLGVARSIEITSDVQCSRCDGRRTADPDGIANCRECHGTGQVHQAVRTPFGQLTQVAPCVACQGMGKVITKPCSECNGRGQVARKRTLEVKIPAGIDTGQLIRMNGEGEPGRMGGPTGDLYLAVDVADHELFERRGDDLVCYLKVKFTDAALGNTIEVPTISGEKEQLKIPPGTQNGNIFRIKGSGMSRLNRGTRGHLHVVTEVMVPTKLNSKQKKLLKDFAEAGSQEAEPSFFNKLRDAIFG